MQSLINQRGETIMEVLLALFIIATISTAIAGSVVMSLGNTALNRDRLIAEGLAREGFEAVTNIRDTNWLRFSEDPENCWNVDPTVELCDPNDPDQVIPPDNYTVTLNVETLGWEMTSIGDALDLDRGDAANVDYVLYVVDRDLDNDTNDDGDFVNDRDLYTHDDFGAVETSKFYRMVTIQCDDGTCQDDQRMTVTSIVQWFHGARTNQVVTSDILANSIF
jgi:type II secretory pathway pseudopilin PulG